MNTNKKINPAVAVTVADSGMAAPATTLTSDLTPSQSSTSPVALIYQWLFDPDFKGGYQRKVDNLVALLIVLSVFAVVFETIPEIHVPNAGWFHAFDLITVGIFTIEYVLRVFSAPMLPEYANSRYPRLQYVFSLYALIDLIAIAPFYLVLLTPVDLEALRVLRLMRLVRIFKLSRVLVPAWEEFQRLNEGRGFRAKVFALLEPTGHSGRLHIFLDNFIVFWIALSMLCVILESVDSIHHLFAAEFYWIDIIAFSIFSVEYVARVYSAPENPAYREFSLPRWAHIRSWSALIDLVTILPFLLEHFLPYPLDLRFLRIFRLTRMLKLTRYTSATLTLIRVVKREWQIIAASIFVMLLMVVLTASLGYLFEHDAQPDKFENIPQSIYWAVVTLASVGYGDISPITPMGRALTVVLALLGIGIFAIPAGLLASAFTDQLRIDRESFVRQLTAAYADGVLDPRENEAIAAEAERLHLSESELNRLLEQAKREFQQQLEANELNFGQLMLDANAHPEFAAEQFRIMVEQLRLILRVTGEEKLAANLSKDSDAALQVLRALALQSATPKAKPKSAKTSDDSSGPQLF
jgi:voltage-gated potassium channel